jgi:hypothetical protein
VLAILGTGFDPEVSVLLTGKVKEDLNATSIRLVEDWRTTTRMVAGIELDLGPYSGQDHPRSS